MNVPLISGLRYKQRTKARYSYSKLFCFAFDFSDFESKARSNYWCVTTSHICLYRKQTLECFSFDLQVLSGTSKVLSARHTQLNAAGFRTVVSCPEDVVGGSLGKTPSGGPVGGDGLATAVMEGVAMSGTVRRICSQGAGIGCCRPLGQMQCNVKEDVSNAYALCEPYAHNRITIGSTKIYTEHRAQ